MAFGLLISEIIWYNTGLLLIVPLESYFSETWIKLQSFSYKKWIWIYRLLGMIVSKQMKTSQQATGMIIVYCN